MTHGPKVTIILQSRLRKDSLIGRKDAIEGTATSRSRLPPSHPVSIILFPPHIEKVYISETACIAPVAK